MRRRTTMRRIENRQLAGLSSLRELQAAKRKINRSLYALESGAREEYRAALEMFSWREALAYGIEIIDGLQSSIRYLGKGLFTGIVSGIRSEIGRKRARRAERKAAKGCGCGCGHRHPRH